MKTSNLKVEHKYVTEAPAVYQFLRPEYQPQQFEAYWETRIYDPDYSIEAVGRGATREVADEDAAKNYKHYFLLRADERLREYNQSVGCYADIP